VRSRNRVVDDSDWIGVARVIVAQQRVHQCALANLIRFQFAYKLSNFLTMRNR